MRDECWSGPDQVRVRVGPGLATCTPALFLALLSVGWNATNAPTRPSLRAVAPLAAVADFLRPSEAWLALAQVFADAKGAHCPDEMDG